MRRLYFTGLHMLPMNSITLDLATRGLPLKPHLGEDPAHTSPSGAVASRHAWQQGRVISPDRRLGRVDDHVAIARVQKGTEFPHVARRVLSARLRAIGGAVRYEG